MKEITGNFSVIYGASFTKALSVVGQAGLTKKSLRI